MVDLIFDPDGEVLLHLSRSLEDDQHTPQVDPSAIANDSNKDRRVETLMLVSSRHMMLASRVFKVMLSNTFSEGLALRSAGKLKLPLPDDDPVAFEILLNIIHGHPRSVPRQIDLQLLRRLAITIDKYELQEVVQVFSDAWLNNLKNTLPKSFTPDLLLWLFIFLVLDKPSEFRHASKIIQLESTGRIGEDLLLNLPLPGSIIGIRSLILSQHLRRADEVFR